MFGSTFETVGILGGLALIGAIIASLFINPAYTVIFYTIAAWTNVAIIVLLCDPFNLKSSK